MKPDKTMKAFSPVLLTLAMAFLVTLPASAQQHGHGAQQHEEMESADSGNPSAMSEMMNMDMSEMPTNPIRLALMDLLAFPMLSSELELTDQQSAGLGQRVSEAAKLAADVNTLGAALSADAGVSTVSAYLSRRAEVLTTLYGSALQAREALSEGQLQAYQDLDTMTRHHATMGSSSHAEIMGLMHEGGDAGMMKMMGGSMGDMPAMEHQNGEEKPHEHKN
jgi:hypothetical protein